MNDLSATTYFKLVSNFLLTVDSSASSEALDKKNGIIEFTAGNLVVRFLPHALNTVETSEPDALVLEVDLMLLDLENREVNHNRFLILHQLNAVSRLTTGIIAFISDQGMLSIGKIIPLVHLDERELTNEVAAIIKAGESLYDGWNQLAELAETTLAATAEGIKEERAVAQKPTVSINEMA